MQSPLKLFRSLKHGDPQAIAVAAVLVFLASVCWFSYTFLVPPKTEALPFGGGRRTGDSMIEVVSLKEVLAVHRVFLTPDDVPNPFYRALPEPRQPRNPRNPKNQQKKPPQNQNNPNTAQQQNPDNPDNPPNKPPQPPAQPEPPKTRPLTLTYQGLLMRPDQTTVALVEVAEDSSRKFIRVGDEISPYRVNEITPEGIQIQQEKGPAIFLQRGIPQRFEIPL